MKVAYDSFRAFMEMVDDFISNNVAMNYLKSFKAISSYIKSTGFYNSDPTELRGVAVLGRPDDDICLYNLLNFQGSYEKIMNSDEVHDLDQDTIDLLETKEVTVISDIESLLEKYRRKLRKKMEEDENG